MNKIKLAFAALAALVGVGAAYASKVKPEAKYATHYWRTIGGATIYYGTTAQAEAGCPGSGRICLMAIDDPNNIAYKSAQ